MDSYRRRRLRLGLKVNWPGQFFLLDAPSYESAIRLYEISDYTNAIEVKVLLMDVIQRRNTRKKRCTEDSFGFDQMILKENIKHQGCRAPYLNLNYEFPICNSKAQMNNSKLSFERAQRIQLPKPCHRIFRIYIDVLDSFNPKIDVLELAISYPEEIQVIKQLKDVDIHAAIGNIGGYFGLVLGKLLNIIWSFEFSLQYPQKDSFNIHYK